MKKSILTIALAILFLATYGQANKPEANSFGIQYGVNFNGTVGQAVQLSGWLKNGVEVRGSMTFSYTNSQSTSISIYPTAGWSGTYYIPANETTTSSSASLTVLPAISVVKHFPVKNNLDFFVGGSANCGFTKPTAWTKSANTEVGDSFYSYSSTNIKNPTTLNWGFSLVGGANYFFYKNLAIGADFSVGFSAANGNGTYQEQTISINTGSYNQQSTRSNYNVSYSNKVTSNKYTASLAGNAGLHLTYYLKVKPKKSKTEGATM
jgi:hypothetical protein